MNTDFMNLHNNVKFLDENIHFCKQTRLVRVTITKNYTIFAKSLKPQIFIFRYFLIFKVKLLKRKILNFSYFTLWVEISLLESKFKATFLVNLYLILLLISCRMLKIELKLLVSYLITKIDLFIVFAIWQIVCLIIRQFHLALNLKWLLDLS